MAERIETVMSAHVPDDGPGYAIGVMRGTDLVVAAGFGYENIETRRPITAETSFNLASLSKQFTGAAVALEILQGSMTLDDRLSDHWPDLPAFMHSVRIDHLVYMTSGLPEYYSLPSPVGDWSSESGFTVDDAIGAVFAAEALEYDPGTRWTYSNINYQLLARLVERLSGDRIADYLSEQLFEPLGMTSSWVDAPLRPERPGRASGYERSGGNWRQTPRRSPHYGGSGVFSSINDLAAWSNALFHSDVLAPGFRELMLTTRRFGHDKNNDAFGLVHGELGDFDTVWYAGSDAGAATYMLHIRDADVTIFCLANFSEGSCGDVARELAGVIIE